MKLLPHVCPYSIHTTSVYFKIVENRRTDEAPEIIMLLRDVYVRKQGKPCEIQTQIWF